MHRPRIAIFVAAFSMLAGAGRADTIVVDDPPIATDYSDGQVDLHTRVTRVTIDDPVDAACIGAGPARRVHGTISGVGRGGYTFALNAAGALVSTQQSLETEYRYTVDYELTYPTRGSGDNVKTMVVFFHGGGSNLLPPLDREYPPPARVSDPTNPLRTLELNLDLSVGKAALLEHASYFAANRWLRAGGGTVATYTGLVYSEALAAAVKARYPNLPGVAAGAPLPGEITNDAAAARDVTRAGQLVHEIVVGAAPRHTLAFGVSGGARLLMQVNSGRDASGRRSGGNHVVPYDPGSGAILEYLIVRGMPDLPGPFWRIDPAVPFAAPMVFVMGNADPRLVNAWAYLAEIAGGRGLAPDAPSPVALQDWFRLYEWRGATHRWASDEKACGGSNNSGLGPMGPFLGAMLRNARERLDGGRPEPDSAFAGHLDGEGRLVFEQTAGGTVSRVPFADDPADTLTATVPAAPTPAQARDWARIDALLPHGPALTPPMLSCRIGTYFLTEGGGQQTPLPALTPYADLTSRWSYSGFVDCMGQAVQALEAQGLYLPVVEHAQTTASAFRALFGAR